MDRRDRAARAVGVVAASRDGPRTRIRSPHPKGGRGHGGRAGHRGGLRVGPGAFGADVALVDRHADLLDGTAGEVEALGRVALTTYGDVRDHAVVDEMISGAVKRFGHLDIVVNNAGGGFVAPLMEVSDKGRTALVDENFTQVVDVIRTAVPHVVEGGSIINITSIEAHRAGPGFAVYSAMKAAVANLTATLSLEFAPLGIRVNAIAPDMIRTPGDAALTESSEALVDSGHAPSPSGGMGDPDDVAAAMVFLAGDMSSFVTGTTLHVDGGTFAASGWRRRISDDHWSL